MALQLQAQAQRSCLKSQGRLRGDSLGGCAREPSTNSHHGQTLYEKISGLAPCQSGHRAHQRAWGIIAGVRQEGPPTGSHPGAFYNQVLPWTCCGARCTPSPAHEGQHSLTLRLASF